MLTAREVCFADFGWRAAVFRCEAAVLLLLMDQVVDCRSPVRIIGRIMTGMLIAINVYARGNLVG